ncbi:MAG: Maf family nucleotide pyrophosphatase [Xanthomonadales bacterium]|jgi:septum formation protein|nr:Maf family nucleotide pyrophosphatase [Xanthomonadales bacterium]
MLVLASASPRRVELLRQLGVDFVVRPAEVPEERQPGEAPEAYGLRVATEKAREAQRHLPAGTPVLGADTEVLLDGRVLGKPRDEAHAGELLLALSGRSHEVLSAVVLLRDAEVWMARSRTRVWFRPLSGREILDYVLGGEPMGKAGAYAIQGRAAAFIERIDGSYSGVMGLPLFETAELLGQAGLPLGSVHGAAAAHSV